MEGCGEGGRWVEVEVAGIMTSCARGGRRRGVVEQTC